VVEVTKPGDWGDEVTFNLLVDGAVAVSRSWPKKVDLPGEAELPFDTLEQTEWGSRTGREYEAEEPTLIIIAQSEEAENVEDWASTNAQTRLHALDYRHYVALAVFQGRQPSSGYGIQINRMTRLREDVNVYVRLYEPEPLTQILDTEAYPYHLVVIEKALVRGATRFNLVVDRMVVASQIIETE
jgi:hypothetical protein